MILCTELSSGNRSQGLRIYIPHSDTISGIIDGDFIPKTRVRILVRPPPTLIQYPADGVLEACTYNMSISRKGVKGLQRVFLDDIGFNVLKK